MKTDNNYQKPYLNTAETANLLGISTGTLNNMCHQHRITFYKFSKEKLFKTTELIELIEKSKVSAINTEVEDGK